jgi:hypothetical protein
MLFVVSSSESYEKAVVGPGRFSWFAYEGMIIPDTVQQVIDTSNHLPNIA